MARLRPSSSEGGRVSRPGTQTAAYSTVHSRLREGSASVSRSLHIRHAGGLCQQRANARADLLHLRLPSCCPPRQAPSSPPQIRSASARDEERRNQPNEIADREPIDRRLIGMTRAKDRRVQTRAAHGDGAVRTNTTAFQKFSRQTLPEFHGRGSFHPRRQTGMPRCMQIA